MKILITAAASLLLLASSLRADDDIDSLNDKIDELQDQVQNLQDSIDNLEPSEPVYVNPTPRKPAYRFVPVDPKTGKEIPEPTPPPGVPSKRQMDQWRANLHSPNAIVRKQAKDALAIWDTM